MFPEKWKVKNSSFWHLNSHFVLKTTKTASFFFFTEILWQTFWSNKRWSVFDVEKVSSYYFFSFWDCKLNICKKKNLCIRWSPLSFWSLFSSAGAIGDGGPFIYYVITCKKVSKRGQKIAIFAYFLYRKYAYVGGRGVQKTLKCAYVIYEWYLLAMEDTSIVEPLHPWWQCP